MSREYTYSTKFNLVDPVLDMNEANKWISAQNMTRWATEAAVNLPEELSNKIIDIDWRLGSRTAGKISVTTSELLTEVERKRLSDWLKYHASSEDGIIGHHFIWEDFARYPIEIMYGKEARMKVDNKEKYKDYHIVAAFDVLNNDYELELEG